jgi:hypothetical protein
MGSTKKEENVTTNLQMVKHAFYCDAAAFNTMHWFTCLRAIDEWRTIHQQSAPTALPW